MGFLRLKFLATALRSGLAPVTYIQNRNDLPHIGEENRQGINIESRDPRRKIQAFLYSPPGLLQSDTEILPSELPVLVNWHGSGFVVSALGTDRVFCAFIARQLGIFVLDVDYRKAPEWPFPAAYHDMEDVMRWVREQPPALLFDADRIAVCGFSAGGTLALEASATHDYVRAVVAVYPTVDLALDPTTKKPPRQPHNEVPAAMQHFFWDCYVPDEGMRSDPRVSPSYWDSSCFPPNVAILSCDGDNLQPEAKAFAARLEDGVRHLLNVTLEGVGHGFDKGAKENTHEFAVRQDAYEQILNFLRASLEM